MFLRAKTNRYVTLIPLVVLLIAVPFIAEAAGPIQKLLYGFIVSVFGFFMGLGGTILNAGVQHFVIDFGYYFGTNSGIGNTIGGIWEIVRDIFNITFIFGLIYLGFKMILNSEDNNTRRWLIHLIMAAVLINFSLLITKSIIDVSNLVASEIAINGFVNEGEINVSDVFRQNMGILSVFGPEAIENIDEDAKVWPIIFGTMVVMIVSAFVFAAGGLLLIIRGAVLVLYMILSPFMFIGWVFPQLQRYTDMYWRGFLGRVFFAPIFLLLLYISSTILIGYQTGIESTSMAEAFTSGMGSENQRGVAETLITSFMPFILGSIFLVASVVTAAKMGANGGAAAVSAGKKYGRWTGRMAARPFGLGARKAAHIGGQRLSSGLTNFQAKERSGRLGKLTTSISKSNLFDKAIRGGAESLENSKMGTGRTRDEDLKYRQKTDTRAKQRRKMNNAEADINGTETSVEKLNEAFKDLSDTMRQMTKDEKMDLGHDKLSKKAYAMNLKDSDIEHFEKSGKFSSQQIQDIRKARKDAIVDTVSIGSVAEPENDNARHPDVKDEQMSNLLRGSVNDIAKLPTEVFTNQASYKHLTPAMVEAKMKEGVSSSELESMKEALTAYTLSASINGRSNETKPWEKWEESNSVHAAKFFS